MSQLRPPALVTGPLNRAAHLGGRTLNAAFAYLGISADPAELLFVPADLIAGDPAIAAEMYRGVYTLAGEAVIVNGASPFQVEPPNDAWRRALHGFSWLRHIHAAENEIANSHARALAHDWLQAVPRNARRMDPGIAARRVINWLRHAPVLGLDLDHNAPPALMSSLVEQVDSLVLNFRRANSDIDRLRVSIAVCLAALTITVARPMMAKADGQLGKELIRQILPDGGHCDRRAESLVDLLLDLLPLRDAYAARGMTPPPELVNAIDRMIPMVRFFTHGDGGLTRFAETSVDRRADIEAVIASAGSLAKPPAEAPHSGYQRLAGGTSVVLVDTGRTVSRPPAGSENSRFGFELSDGPHRIVVGNAWFTAPDETSTGSPIAERLYAMVCLETPKRRTPLQLSRLLAGRALLHGAPAFTVARSRTDAGQLLEICHDRFVPSHRLIHHRTLLLSADGLDLRGEDRLSPVRARGADGGETTARIHFPLHPALKVSGAKDGASVLIILANRVGWQFSADGALISIEPCVTHGDDGNLVYGSRIVLSASTADELLVRWSFKRISKKVARTVGAAPVAPLLPL